MALLALIAIGGGPAGGAPGQRERADGRIAYTVVIDRGDCGRVIDCVDSPPRGARPEG